jgi:hypothetical protein
LKFHHLDHYIEIEDKLRGKNEKEEKIEELDEKKLHKKQKEI